MNEFVIDRRSFLGLTGSSLALLGSSSVVALPAIGRTQIVHDPMSKKFILFVVVGGGWDPTCFCDARPRSMTDAGLQQNYFSEHPERIVGVNGGSSLVTSAFAPLKSPFADRAFSILNGVVMSVGNDGHDQNFNYVFTGNPFGGDSLLPHLSQSAGNFPLSYLQMATLFGVSITNGSSAITMDAESARAFAEATRAAPAPDLRSPLFQYLNQRSLANSQGLGKLSHGVARFRAALENVGSVREKVASIDLQGLADLNETEKSLRLVHSFFKASLTNAALISVNDDIFVDAHDVGTASQQPAFYLTIADRIAKVFNYLSNTRLNESEEESLLSQTTVVVTSEFSRTMRQGGKPISESGTDHNPLNNSVLIGGRGVRGGDIFGESDFAQENEVLSGAHLAVDPYRFRLMARPFNFTDLSPIRTAHDRFDIDAYISFANIGNTLMHAHGVDSSLFWKNDRNGAAASILDSRIYR